ncbi:acyl carrier protein [Streptomyces sp. NPDC057644]|uniref:acyl carrier protein n=1 Tax=Streptomyces sp. NPDC057644 TaxID=3346191 RepID=UPI00368E59B3
MWQHTGKRGISVSTAIRDERLVTIKEIVCDILEIEEDEVTEVSLFKEDHNADSLRAIEILAALEKEFKVVINQSELPRMVNLEGVYAVVSESAGW